MFIRNAWYAAALSSEIKPAELFARTVLCEPLVLYRTASGHLATLADRCAHRQVPLSKGRLQGDLVECWYHGLRYDRTGSCVHIPSQDAIPARACVRRFPSVEKHGLVWVWMGDIGAEDSARIPDHWVCATPELAGNMSYCHVNCEYRFGIDNILDISHAAFVHSKTLGSLAVAETSPEISVLDDHVRVRRSMRNEKTPPLYQRAMQLDCIDRIQDVNFWPIGNTRVDTVAHPPNQPDGPSLRVFTTTIFTPATEKTSHIFVGMHRSFDRENTKLTDFITQEIISTVLEDKAVTEALQANWRDDAPMVPLKVDRAALAARQILDRLAGQEVRSNARGSLQLFAEEPS